MRGVRAWAEAARSSTRWVVRTPTRATAGDGGDEGDEGGVGIAAVDGDADADADTDADADGAVAPFAEVAAVADATIADEDGVDVDGDSWTGSHCHSTCSGLSPRIRGTSRRCA